VSVQEVGRRSLAASAEVLARAAAGDLAADVATAAGTVVDSLRTGGKVLIFGNGGSAADAQHFAAELVGRFRSSSPARRALPAIALTTDTSALTALANDIGFEAVFARQVEALGRPFDVAIGISTSGRSANVVEGLRRARALGLRTVALVGAAGGPVADSSENAVRAPSDETPRVQEVHAAVLHAIAEAVEANPW
jgi:D-sedoheptulose 7-phosphate isomerase